MELTKILADIATQEGKNGVDYECQPPLDNSMFVHMSGIWRIEGRTTSTYFVPKRLFLQSQDSIVNITTTYLFEFLKAVH